MGIEAIGGGIGAIGVVGAGIVEVGAGAAAVSGPALSLEGPTFAAAPVLGSIEQFGPKLEAVSLPFIDSPISKGEIFNMVPYKISSVFEPAAMVEPILDAPAFTPTAAIAEVEAILANKSATSSVVNFEAPPGSPMETRPHFVQDPPGWQPKSAEPLVIPSETRNLPTESIVPNQEIAASLAVLAPRNDEVVDPVPVEAIFAATDAQPKAETSPVTSQAEAAREEQVVEQAVRPPAEEVTEKRQEEDPETRQQEDVEELTVKYVEAEDIAGNRVYQLGKAIDQADAVAKAAGKDKIERNSLKQFFAPEDVTNRSPITNPEVGDGGLEKTYEVVGSRDYSSADEAKKASEKAVEDFKPVKKSKGWGKLVKGIDIARARKDQIFKSHPAEEVVARITKITKTVEAKAGTVKTEVTTAVKPEEPSQGKIEDFPKLAEVFPKASH